MDITFWVIQGVLLTPVLFLAASVGGERPGSAGLAPPLNPLGKPEPRPSPFTAEQRARLLILRAFVREAKMGRGALQDDLGPMAEPAQKRRGVSRRHLWLAAGCLLILIGAVGVVRTNMAIDDIQRNATARFDPLSPAARFLPGVVVNPAKYLSAVNGGSGTPTLEAAGVMEQKQAMDRWEALALVGLGILLFTQQAVSEEGAVASDVAPFVLVAAFLFAALSLFELP